MKKYKGAVSVFLIIVLFTTILFGGLLIDATRILLAKRFIRNTIDSAARSALSYYDTNLSNEYGLFAVDEDEAKEQFRRYVKTNIALSKSNEFNIFSVQVEDDDIKVSVSQPIKNTETMLSSMEEYSKYRSVVNTGYILVNKVSGIFSKTSSKVFNAADTGKTALETLKSDVTEFSNSARTLISTGIDTTATRINNTLSAGLKNGKTTVDSSDLGFDEMQKSIDDASEKSSQIGVSKDMYNQKNKAAAEELQGSKVESTTYYDDEKKQMETAKGQTVADGYNISAAESTIPSAADAADKEKAAVDEQISQTQQRLDKNKVLIQTKANDAATKNVEIKQFENEISACKESIKVLQAGKAELEKKQKADNSRYIQGDLTEYIEKMKSDIEEATETKGDKQCMQHMLDYCYAYEAWKNASNAEKTETANVLNTKIKELQNCYKKYGKKLTAKGDEEIAEVKLQITSMQSQQSELEAAKKRAERERDKLIEEIESLYKGIPASKTNAGKLELPKSVTGEDKEATTDGIGSFFISITETIQSAIEETQKIASDVNGKATLEEVTPGLDDMLDNVFETVDSIKTTADSIVTLITAPEEVGDAFLFTDYVFDNHTFLTSQTKRSNRHFQAGEIEYILQGYDSQAKCIMHSLLDIVELRLMINFVDYMCTTQSPEIISRTIIALGRAGIRTAKDMASMIFTLDDKESASCGLCPSFDKVRLTYSDHLRLKMLIESIGDKKRNEMMGRVQTLMLDTFEVQDWGDLSKLNTYLSGEVTVKVDLVMLTLPIFENMLPEDNQILQDGKFLVHERVSMGY